MLGATAGHLALPGGPRGLTWDLSEESEFKRVTLSCRPGLGTSS
jgi:hypothetical protein